MDVVVVRHAIAELPETFAESGRDDSLRPLTERGRKRMYRAAAGIRRLMPRLDVVATSPYTRACETAEIVAAAYDGLEPVEVGCLTPGSDPDDVIRWLRRHENDSIIAVIGHEPDLSRLLSWCLAARPMNFVEFKKGGACLLTWTGTPSSGTATLAWALRPAQLRMIGKA